MTYETISYELFNTVGVLTINRPSVHNAMNQQCLAEFTALIESIRVDQATRVLIIKGAGSKAFTAGADLNEFAAYNPDQAKKANQRWLALFEAIETLPQPVIAQVQGHAPGGGTELTLCCDFVVCADTAAFSLAEINIGVIPGAGAGIRLTRWLGRLKAKEIIMLGDIISGNEAVSIGIANKCVPHHELENAAKTLAVKLSKKPPLALAAAKSVVNFASELEMPRALETQLNEFVTLFATDDQKEGMSAFLEKREATFTGK